MQVLLAWKGDVNSRDYDGETPLHLAVKLPGSYEYSPPQVDRIWGNIRVILGLYRDNGKENGDYYLGFRVFMGYSPP